MGKPQQQPTDDQPALFSRQEMRPVFGGRQLRPGFETSADAMPLFAPAVEAEREALATMPTDQLMRDRGDTDLFQKGYADMTDEEREAAAYEYAQAHGLSWD